VVPSYFASPPRCACVTDLSSPMFCCVFVCRRQVATDAVIYVKNACTDLVSAGKARGGISGVAVGLAGSLWTRSVALLHMLSIDQAAMRALEAADSAISKRVRIIFPLQNRDNRMDFLFGHLWNRGQRWEGEGDEWDDVPFTTSLCFLISLFQSSLYLRIYLSISPSPSFTFSNPILPLACLNEQVPRAKK
jgi:hypothetical protein